MSSTKVALSSASAEKPLDSWDFGLIKGLEAAKRAITVALAGEHAVVMAGPSGCGKSMLVQAAQKIDPEFRAHEITTCGAQRVDAPRLLDFGLRGDIDIHIEVPRLSFRDWASKRPGTDTACIRDVVLRARAFAQSHQDTTLNEGCLLLAKQAYEELMLTPRSMSAIVKIARTIASMDQSAEIQEHHLAEAIEYRLFDRRTS